MPKTARRIPTLILAAVIAVVGRHPASASETAKAVPNILLTTMSQSREDYIAALFRPFRALSGDDQILSAEDLEISSQLSLAAARARALSQILIYDLNGDAIVTSEELSLSRRQNPFPSDNLDRMNVIETADANHDGQITVQEAMGIHEKVSSSGDWNRQQGTALFALDPNADGRLTSEELQTLALTAFAKFDLDANGVLSPAEAQARRQALRNEQQAENPANPEDFLQDRCGLPEAPAGSDVVVLGSFGSGTLSTVATAGQQSTTEVSELFIEPGTTPLYILALPFRPTIWHVTGAVDRIAVLATGPTYPSKANVAVSGLPMERITFLPKRKCLDKVLMASLRNSAQLKSRISEVLKRPVIAMIAGRGMSRIGIPSGEIEIRRDPAIRHSGSLKIFDAETRPASVDPMTFKQFYLLRPGGIVDIPMTDIVAPGEVMPYMILPQEAGLIQLMQDGLLERRTDGAYLIKRPFERYPTGLFGIRSVIFILPKGMPAPQGPLEHSQILIE